MGQTIFARNTQANILHQESSQVSQLSLYSSLQFLISANLVQYNSPMKVQKYFYDVLLYLNKQHKINKAQQIIKRNSIRLLRSALLTFKMYIGYLNKIVPTNISYIHFLRETQLSSLYIVTQYILKIGMLKNNQQMTIFNQIQYNQIIKSFTLILHFTYIMVQYECSAIFSQSSTLYRSIETNFILICGLLSNQDCDVFNALKKPERTHFFNIFLYVLVYVITKASKVEDKSINKYQKFVDIGVLTLHKVIRKTLYIKVKLYAPSYWYIEQLGYIKKPYLTDILVQSLLQFMIKIKKLQLEPQSTTQLLILSFINTYYLLYNIENKAQVSSYLWIYNNYIKLSNLQRSFLISIIKKLKCQQLQLQQYSEQLDKPFRINNKLMSLELVCKNWLIFEAKMNSIYLISVINDKIFTITTKSIWRIIIKYNVHELVDIQHYKAPEYKYGVLQQQKQQTQSIRMDQQN